MTLMLTTLFTPWCLKSCSFSSHWCKHLENGVLTWREAEKSSCGFLQRYQDPSVEGHGLLFIFPPQILQFFFCGDCRKNWKSSQTHHQMHWTRWCWLKLALIPILVDLLLTLLHQKCPSFLTAPFTPLPPSCPSDLLDLVLSFWRV